MWNVVAKLQVKAYRRMNIRQIASIDGIQFEGFHNK